MWRRFGCVPTAELGAGCWVLNAAVEGANAGLDVCD